MDDEAVAPISGVKAFGTSGRSKANLDTFCDVQWSSWLHEFITKLEELSLAITKAGRRWNR